MSEYCTIQDIRDEGFLIALYSDARVTAAIRVASAFIEEVTGRWFEARTRTLKVRAQNTRVLEVKHPIITVTGINVVVGRGSAISRSEIDVDDILVFNRHLTEGLYDPDDRDDPRIEYENPVGIEYPGALNAQWPWGAQIVEVAGRFGYTELAHGVDPAETSDGSQVPASEGVTPVQIEQVCKLLTIRELPLMSDFAAREDLSDRHRLESEKTADQSYKKSSLSSSSQEGYITGDPTIDRVLVRYMSPQFIGVV